MHVVFDTGLCERTDRQTYTLITILRRLTAGEVNNEIQEKGRLGAKRLATVTGRRQSVITDKSHIAVLCYYAAAAETEKYQIKRHAG